MKLILDYLAVDDYHFLAAGKQIDELDGYFTTDEQDARLAVFPISQKLRYAIPFPRAYRDNQLFKINGF